MRARFDRIFVRTTGFATLDRLLQRLHANKAELLMVRKRPLTTADCGAALALALGYFVQRQGSSSSIRWMG
jgi:hypothetical protein